MRPLFHPSVEEVTVEGIIHALSDPVRAAIFADIVSQECPQSCSMFLTVSDRAIPKSTLSQHFRSLREAGLIRGERRGVEMRNISRSRSRTVAVMRARVRSRYAFEQRHSSVGF
jgi:DNA-binding transcriptional ArsR family regulator